LDEGRIAPDIGAEIGDPAVTETAPEVGAQVAPEAEAAIPTEAPVAGENVTEVGALAPAIEVEWIQLEVWTAERLGEVNEELVPVL
jgi:hypothetical protein